MKSPLGHAYTQFIKHLAVSIQIAHKYEPNKSEKDERESIS